MEHAPALCGAFHRAIELIGRRWTGAIIFLLLRRRIIENIALTGLKG